MSKKISVKVKSHSVCTICGQQTYQKAFVGWFCEYLFFYYYSFNRFTKVEKCEVTPQYLYCHSWTLKLGSKLQPFKTDPSCSESLNKIQYMNIWIFPKNWISPKLFEYLKSNISEYLRSRLFPRSGVHSIPQKKFYLPKGPLDAFIYWLKHLICQEFNKCSFFLNIFLAWSFSKTELLPVVSPGIFH